MYRYVVVAPTSYEHAQTSTRVSRKQSWNGPASRSKHTVPEVGGSPMAGWGVASQPPICVPQARSPGATADMRYPAAPVKRYHGASSTTAAETPLAAIRSSVAQVYCKSPDELTLRDDPESSTMSLSE